MTGPEEGGREQWTKFSVRRKARGISAPKEKLWSVAWGVVAYDIRKSESKEKR